MRNSSRWAHILRLTRYAPSWRHTGSKTTIHRYLKEIEEEEGTPTGRRVAVSDALQDLVARLAGCLHEEADARVGEASEAFQDVRVGAPALSPWLAMTLAMLVALALGLGP